MNLLFSSLTFFFLTLSSFLFAQAEQKDKYDLLLSEVDLLTNYVLFNEESLALIDTAKAYARVGQFELATIFLETILIEIRSEQNLTRSDQSQKAQKFSKKYGLTLNSGIDFNRQEFEVGYLQTDSILVDEVRKPFLGVDFRYFLKGDYDNGLTTDLSFRLDKENSKGNIHLTAYRKNKRYQGLASFGMIYDQNKLYRDLGYWELNSKQSFSYMLSTNWYFQLNNEFRFKEYQKPSEGIPSFLKDDLRASLNFSQFTLKDFEVSYTMDLNESKTFRNNDYFEQELSFRLRNWIFRPIPNQFLFGVRYNDFAYALQDSIIDNLSLTYSGWFKTDISLSNSLDWEFEYTGRYKIYSKKSEQDPDYFLHELNVGLNQRWDSNFLFGTGYKLEYKKHELYSGANGAYIKEQNYAGNGIFVGLDYNTIHDLFFSITASYTWRRYPDNDGGDVLSYYSNRNVLTLFLLSQIPIAKDLKLNILTSYDNDQDLDNDINDTRSALFSAEFTYSF